MDRDVLVEFTVEIVTAHVANNSVEIDDMPKLIAKVHEALGELVAGRAASPVGKVPIVAIEDSVERDHIICLECGQKQKILKLHLLAAHGLTPKQYRAAYGLPASYPLTAPGYSDLRRQMAHAVGLGGINRPAKSRG